MKKFLAWLTIFIGISGPLYSEEVTLPGFGKISHFRLSDAQGGSRGLEDLAGKVWIANFIFTRCAGPCPLISAKMANMTKAFESQDAVRFVSFSVDPDYDSPERLRAYAQKYSADMERWHFLTGDKAEIFRLSQQDFHLGIEQIPAEDEKDAGQPLLHSTKFVLVDASGEIRGYYDSDSDSSLEQLAKDAKALIK